MGKKNNQELSINQDLLKEYLSGTSRKSIIQSPTTLLPGEVKGITGGIDFGEAQEYLGGDAKVFDSKLAYKLGEKQSAPEKWANFGVQVGAEVLGGTIEGIGYLADVSGLVETLDGDFNSFGNWLSDIGASIKEGSKEDFAIYGSQDMGNLGFWLDNGVSVASSLSLMLPAVGTVRGLGALGKAVGLAGKLGKPLEAGMSILGQSVASRHMENMMEAKGTWEGTRKEALAAGASYEDANKAAAVAASNLYKVNYTLLAQDLLSYSLLARGPKLNQAITSKRLADATNQSLGKTVGSSVFPFVGDAVSEGVEEGLQFIFSEESKYRALANAGIIDKEKASDRTKRYMESSDMWTSMLFGAIGAGVMQGGGNLLKMTNIPIFGGKAEREYLENRIKFANESFTEMQAAGVELNTALQNDDTKGVIEAENKLGFNAAMNAAQLGLMDTAKENIDNLITSIRNSEDQSGYDPNYANRLETLKKDMDTVGNLYRSNARKYEPSTVRSITYQQYKIGKTNEQLQKANSEHNEAVSNFPRVSELTSKGKEQFDLLVEREALLQFKALNKLSEQEQNIERASEDYAASNESIDTRIKEIDTALNEIKESEKKDLKSAGQGAQVTNRINQAKRDNKILDTIPTSGKDVIASKTEQLYLDKIIDDANTLLKTFTSKDGQKAAEKEADKIREIEKQRKIDEKNNLRENQKNNISNSINKSHDNVNKTDDKPKVEPKPKGGKKKKPPGKKLSELPDAVLDNILTNAQDDNTIAEVKAEQARRKEENKSDNQKEQETAGNNFDQNVVNKANVSGINSKDIILTPTNENVEEDLEDKLPEVEFVAETGFAIAWKTTNAVEELDRESDYDDLEMADAVTELFEDPDVNLTDYSLEFYVDQEELDRAKTYKTDDPVRQIADAIAAGKDYSNLIGLLPIKAYVLNSAGERVNVNGRDMYVPVHDTTFGQWDKLDPAKRENAISETEAIKEAVVEAQAEGKTLVAPISFQRRGNLVKNEFSEENLVNVATALNVDSSEIELVVGGKNLPGTKTSQYLTGNKELAEGLEDYSSAEAGAIYAKIKANNGEDFPLRLFVSNLSFAEKEIVYELYKKTLENSDAYMESLDRHEDILGLVSNAPDVRVSGLLDFINSDTNTLQDLLSMLVYEGSGTKNMGDYKLLSSPDGVRIGKTFISKDEFGKASGKTKFLNAIENKNRQIPTGLLTMPGGAAYLIDSEVLTTTLKPEATQPFRQGTVVFGEPKAQETTTPSSNIEAKKADTTSADSAQVQPGGKDTKSEEVKEKVNEIKGNIEIIKGTDENGNIEEGGNYSHYSKIIEGKVVQTYKRVSSVINPITKMTPMLDSASTLGTAVDGMVRDFFTTGIKDYKEYGISSKEDFDSFVEQLQELKARFDANGEIVEASGIVLYSDEMGIAGTVDILTYDAEGNFRIYDLKGQRGNQLTTFNRGETVPKYDSVAYGKSYRRKHAEQLSLYKMMLEKTHGVNVKHIEILPVELKYQAGEYTTEVLNMLPPIPHKPLSQVGKYGGKTSNGSGKPAVKTNVLGTTTTSMDSKTMSQEEASQMAQGTNVNSGVDTSNSAQMNDLRAKIMANLSKKKNVGTTPEDNKYRDQNFDNEFLKVREAEDTAAPITIAEIEKVMSILPEGIAIEMIGDYIGLLSGGRKAVGLFRSGLIQLSVKAKAGDGFHEAFHAVFRTVLNTQQQQELLQEVKDNFLAPAESQIQEFMDRHSLSREEAIDLFYEEQLADEFAEYAKDNANYEDIAPSNKILKFFERMWAWLKNIIYKEGNYQRLFKDILDGKFSPAENLDVLIESGAVESVNNITGKPC